MYCEYKIIVLEKIILHIELITIYHSKYILKIYII